MVRIPKESQYPKEIYIRDDSYKVKFVRGLKDIGNTDPDTKIIRIRKGMSRNETFRTFIHEALHAVEFSWPIPMKHKLVYELEEAISQLILDNFL